MPECSGCANGNGTSPSSRGDRRPCANPSSAPRKDFDILKPRDRKIARKKSFHALIRLKPKRRSEAGPCGASEPSSPLFEPEEKARGVRAANQCAGRPPAIASIGMCFPSSARNTPTCAMPRAAPPERANPHPRADHNMNLTLFRCGYHRVDPQPHLRVYMADLSRRSPPAALAASKLLTVRV